VTVGQKIRRFRKRAGLSQLSLELAIEASPGSLSRIESGKVNPTKETIVDIATALELETKEIACLFGIEVYDNNHLFEETTKILSTHNLQEALDMAVNNLIFKMGYIGSCIFLADGNKVGFSSMTNSKLGNKVLACLDKPLSSLSFSLTKDTSNLTVKAIKERKVYLTYYTREYTVPAITVETADRIQEVTGDKSNIIYPLFTDDEPFGAIVYVKNVVSDFKDERETLRVISKQIAVAIQNARKFESLLNTSSKPQV
jgi:transcriptional regulator with XRE-family HTH domain